LPFSAPVLALNDYHGLTGKGHANASGNTCTRNIKPKMSVPLIVDTQHPFQVIIIIISETASIPFCYKRLQTIRKFLIANIPDMTGWPDGKNTSYLRISVSMASRQKRSAFFMDLADYLV
jgi:hypothetical protein